MSGLLAGLSAGLGAVSSYLGYKGQKDANKTNIQLQREQNAFTERMWEKNNAYNDPSQHMQRLMAAGISPTFAGQTVNGGEAQQVSGQSPAHVDNVYGNLSSSVGNTISQLYNIELADSQVDLNKTRAKNETAETLANIALKGKEAGLKDSQTVYQDILNMFATERQGYETMLQKANINKITNEAVLSLAKANESNNQSDRIKAETDLVNIQTKLLPLLTAAQMYSLKTNANAALMNAITQSNMSKAQIHQAEAMTDKIIAETLGATSQSEILKIEKELAEKLGCDPKTAAMFVGSVLSALSKIKH